MVLKMERLPRVYKPISRNLKMAKLHCKKTSNPPKSSTRPLRNAANPAPRHLAHPDPA
ncbi:Hypothetical predicted protein [Pelobates cultripes]|uniref:Uncharacterized protein n=1 Tax=Pelobates cultripes TaxID=61616 RepID=A0AAD1VSN4_PELCU|nr:Hypothetical predicted protein [Pelobates cultripes]